MNDSILDLFCSWQRRNSPGNDRHLEMVAYGQFKLMQTQQDFTAFCACIEMLKPFVDDVLSSAMFCNMNGILASDFLKSVFDVECAMPPAGSP